MRRSEILTRARELIATPDKWCQGAVGFTFDGIEIEPCDLDFGAEAVRLCAFGAIRAVTRNSYKAQPANRALARAAGCGYGQEAIDWNNDLTRSHVEVLAAFDRAIEATK